MDVEARDKMGLGFTSGALMTGCKTATQVIRAPVWVTWTILHALDKLCPKRNRTLEQIPAQNPAYSSPFVTATQNIEHEAQLLLFEIMKFGGDCGSQ